jgi:lipopolysaccharide/colanic/teichoic acid biosynthesis glycosyltransferase
VTRIGRFLRRTSLDELPQLFNVLKGDMSMVGPRPEDAEVVKRYNLWHRKRLSVKPGITGPMQVNGRGDLPLDERIRLELLYIADYSILTDVKYLLRTIPTVLRGSGAY